MKNQNKKIEEMLHSAFADAVPDRSDEIIRRASKKHSGALMMVSQPDYRSRYLHYAAMAAAALVIIVGIAFVISFARSREAVGTVTVEGSECYEIALNRNCRPLSVTGRDSVARQAAQRIDGDCGTLREAVGQIVGVMLDTGSLHEDNNTVLITVSYGDASGDQLAEAINAAQQRFEEAGFDGAILATVASEEREVLRIAEYNRVSVGKAELVRDILAADASLHADALCRLSINDLNLFSLYRRITYADVSACGLSHGCITPEEAAELALRGLDDPTATAEAILTCDEIGLFYAVTVSRGDEVFSCRLSALTGERIGEETPDVTEPPTELPTSVPTVPATQPTEPAAPPTSGSTALADPQRPTTPQPTAPVPTALQPTTPKPTEPEPDVFTRTAYFRYTAGVYGEEILPAAAKQISVRRIANGYDTYYNDATFPYTAQGEQGGITALVFNTAQFRSLTGTDDDRFDDAYFATHALYIYINRDAQYHWTKSINAAYVDGSVLYIESAEPVGRYVGDGETRIHTVIYELDKDDLRSFTSMLEFV